MVPKRTIESEDGSSTPNKRQRMSRTAVLTEQIVETAKSLLDFIPSINLVIERRYHTNEQYLLTVTMWEVACSLAQGNLPWTKEDLRLLDERLPDEDPVLRTYNAKYTYFSNLQKAKLFSLPSPSDFGKNWSQYESIFEDRLLCCRPPDSRGLPLCTLHHVFRRYCLNVQKPLPQGSETATAAMNAAKLLCATMGNSFSTESDNSSVAQQAQDFEEDARVRKFDDCIRGILEGYDKSVVLRASCELSTGVVDGVLSEKDVPLSLRVVKGEPGANGDPYMQAVRSYDLAVNVLRESETRTARAFVAQGVPMFMVCVSGPSLMVAGGFWDGDKVIVEQLEDTCTMLKDYTDRRRDKLARVLYALATGIDELRKSVSQILPSCPTTFPSFTPRIYGSCTLYDSSQPARLVFIAKFEPPDSNRLLFTASLSKSSSAESIPVLVKLVNEGYGVDVHHLLSRHNLAPTLHAYSEVEGAPTAYIMEYLDPSWKPLSNVSAHPDTAALIHFSIDKVIKLLQKNGVVHGDLRSPNILVNVSATTGGIITVEDESGKMRANIKVVDFDWAGEAGRVVYPLSRNPDIAGTWPGKPGGAINKDHDRRLFNSWWLNLVSAWGG